MSPRPIQPNSTAAGGPIAPFLILAIAGAAAAVAGEAWLAGRLAAVVTGHPWATGPHFGEQFIVDLAQRRWDLLWPGIPRVAIAALFGVLLAATAAGLTTGWAWWVRHRPRSDDPRPALAGPDDIAGHTLGAVTRRARQLSPRLAAMTAQNTPASEAGVALGRLISTQPRPPMLYASVEDTVVVVMGPRAGKTTGVTAPALLAAPGAALATMNKADLWATTVAARSKHGPVWLFDPQSITHQEQEFWWNPLAEVDGREAAHQLAAHFIQQIHHRPGGSEDFWIMAAHDLLTSFILAAAFGYGTLDDVQAWLSDPTSRQPATILRENGFTAVGRALAGRQAGAPETRDGVYETARTAAACLADPRIMRWVTPPDRHMAAIDVAAFPASAGTLYLLSKDGAGSAAPLVAGLTDQVLRAAERTAEASGGRLDPAFRAVLDEACNICPIGDLPKRLSHFGSRGIIPITILQSYAQGVEVWGDAGMATLWSVATVKLVGSGVDDAKFAEDVSRLVGDHDVAVASRTLAINGHHTAQTSLRRQRILDAADIRALRKGTALLLASGTRPALIELLPWFDGDHAAELTADRDAATQSITDRAAAAFRGQRPVT